MIISFLNKDTKQVFDGVQSSKFPSDIQSTARRKLFAIHFATSLADLASVPGNHLERLSGDRAGQWSIRIASGVSASSGTLITMPNLSS